MLNQILLLNYQVGKGKPSPTQSLSGKLKENEAGFSLIEVLVTILVITLFLLGALQATVLATLIRVQGQDKTEASNWIQRDLELIRSQSFNLDRTGTSYSPNTASCTGSIYGSRLGTNISGAFPEETGIIINVNNKPYQIFRDYLPVGNVLRITYTVSYAAAHPRYIASASYNAGTLPTPPTNANIISTLSTEVVPNASLSCP